MSKFDDFLAFDPNYLESQVQQQKERGVAQRRWGCGEIHNSNTGFWLVGGATTRTPDRYHRTDYETGMYKKQKLLDTREMVHASVRARLRHGGGGPNGESKYHTPFTIEWKHDGKWAYIGKSKDGQGLVMVEDELGVYEKQLLKLTGSEEDQKLFGH